MENQEHNLAALEALLFIHGEPLAYKKIQAVLHIEDRAELDALIEICKKQLESEGRGLQIISDKEKIQLATKPAFNGILEDFVKEEISEDLSPASLEALAIISYLGPISRVRLEYLRGVNSSVILRSLMIRGLIERFADPEHPATYLYRPTFDLMKHLGIKEKGELPEFGKFQELLNIFDNPPADAPAQTAEAVVEAASIVDGAGSVEKTETGETAEGAEVKTDSEEGLAAVE